jgi:diadenosine tetraphosphate (Ap4A) HIT family hydrolase
VNDSDCPFCKLINEVSADVHRYGTVVVFPDFYPVTQGHLLVVPSRHITDLFEMDRIEVRDLIFALKKSRSKLLGEDTSIVGFNVGVNIGEAAGQTVAHAHLHLIPRRHGDTARPAGGVRAVIPSRKLY